MDPFKNFKIIQVNEHRWHIWGINSEYRKFLAVIEQTKNKKYYIENEFKSANKKYKKYKSLDETIDALYQNLFLALL